MTGLLDLEPLGEEVDLGRGRALTVHGISVDDILHLTGRFAAFRDLFGGGEVQISAKLIVDMGTEVVGAVIACASRDGDRSLRGDRKAEARARGLPVAAQLKVVLAVIKLTFPEGMDPFAEQMSQLLRFVKPARKEEVSDPSSPGYVSASVVGDDEAGAPPRHLRRVS